MPENSNDSIDLIVSLLVRHPELSRVVIKPRVESIAFFFAVRDRLSRLHERNLRHTVTEHLEAFHALLRTRSARTRVRTRTDAHVSFVEIERDATTLTRDEIPLIVALVSQCFGDRLIVNPPAEEAGDEELEAHGDAVGPALDAVRHAKQRKGLVGFRDERRLLICFGGPK